MTEDERSAAAQEQAESAPDQTEARQAAPDTGAAEAGDDAHTRLAALERQMSELERQLAVERDAASDYMQRWQRTQADFANFRRRAQQEQEQRDTVATGRALAGLLPALDSFERAFAALPETLRGFSWLDGIALIDLQLRRALEAHEVRPIAAEPGAAFDPQRHESIGEVESDQYPAGSVAAIVQQGYELHGLVLRPALVQLARARGAAPEPAAAVTADAAASSPEPEAATLSQEEGDSGGG
jgi:molecular chaperone GrpE